MTERDGGDEAADERGTSNGREVTDERGNDGRPDGDRQPADGGSNGTGRCTEDRCEEPAAVRLHIPWAENRVVCPAHARVLGRQDGVVADPLAGAEEEWP